MANKAGRSVYQREDGKWVNKNNNALRAGSLHTLPKMRPSLSKPLPEGEWRAEHRP